MSDDNVAKGFRWNYYSSLPEGPYRKRIDDFLASVRWQRLLDYIVTKRNGMNCKLLPDIGVGFNHMVRVVEFEDNVRWVARLRMPSINGGSYLPSTANAMKSEMNAAVLVQTKTNVPVPVVHAMETSDLCVGAPFTLMDCLDGNVGMDLGMDVPRERKEAFYQELARIQVALFGIRLPKIGTILSINEDGSYTQGPIPGVGGPFDTATEYFRAWAKSAEFGMSEERLRQASGEFADEIVRAVADFPESIKQLASCLSTCDRGPFPLCHGDFGHNNIVVNDEYETLGVIDWEFAFAAPWEVAGNFPLTLSITPQAMDAPWNYDASGNPIGTDLVEGYTDQQNYTRAVEEEEERLGIAESSSLAKVLKDESKRGLATAMRLYKNGKLGFYSGVIEQLDPHGFRSRNHATDSTHKTPGEA